MVEERRELQEAMKQIQVAETKNVDKALARSSLDGAPPVPKKKGHRNNNFFRTTDDDYGGTRGNGW